MTCRRLEKSYFVEAYKKIHESTNQGRTESYVLDPFSCICADVVPRVIEQIWEIKSMSPILHFRHQSVI